MKKKIEPELSLWLCVSDVERSSRFYETGLGFVREDQPHPVPSGEEVHLKSPDGKSGVTCVSLDRALSAYKNRFPSLDHRLGVGTMIRLTVVDVDAAFARALSGGGLALEPPNLREDGVREGCLRDPDGYLVSFVSRPSS